MSVPEDEHLDRPIDGPAVRFSRAEDDPAAVVLWYGTFERILRALHDLWWRDRTIERLGLLADWLGDRGLFDPEDGRSVLIDTDKSAAALRLVRDALARRADTDDAVDGALAALIPLLDDATDADLPVRADRV